MRGFPAHSRVLAYPLVAAALATLPVAVRAEPAGEITSITGTVQVQLSTGERQTAAVGQQLEPGTLLRTGADGEAEVALGEGRQIRMRPRTVMRISGNQVRREKRSVVLFFGRLWNRITSTVGHQRRYDLVTQTAIAGVRGTDFETWAGADGAVKLWVTEGTVGVDGKGGEVLVHGAEEVNVASQSAPGPVGPHTEQTWETWAADRDERLRIDGSAISSGVVTGAKENEQRLETLIEEQEKVRAERRDLLAKADPSDASVADELAGLDEQIVDLGDNIGAIADQTDAQAGYLNEVSELANDPSFGMANAEAVLANAKAVQQIQQRVSERAAGVPVEQAAAERPDAAAEGGLDALARQGKTMIQRVRNAARQVKDLHAEAVVKKDQVRATCVLDIKSTIDGLASVADVALSDLESAAARRDGQAADDAYARLSVSAQKCDQLVSEAQACAGELDVYAGKTEVETEVDEEVAGDADEPAPELGVSPDLERAASRPLPASPYQ